METNDFLIAPKIKELILGDRHIGADPLTLASLSFCVVFPLHATPAWSHA